MTSLLSFQDQDSLYDLIADDDAEIKKKKPTTTIFHNSHQGVEDADSTKKGNNVARQMMNALHLDAPNSKEITMHDSYEVFLVFCFQ